VGDNEHEAANNPVLSVARCWAHGRRMLLLIEGINTIDDAQPLLHSKLWVQRHDVSIDDDEYLWHDLIGMQVVNDVNKEPLGCVRAVQDFGAQDTLMVESNEGEWMIPFVDGIIIDVDDARHIIHVQLPEGMEACFTPKS